MKNEKKPIRHVLADQTKSRGNIAFIINDKVLLSYLFRMMLLGHTKTNGHEYASKKVLIFKNNAFLDSDDFGNEIIFIPCLLADDDEQNREPIPYPAYMLRLSHGQIMEIIGYLKKAGYDCGKEYFKLFFKPKVSITYEDRIDLGSEYFEAENEDCHLKLFDEKPSDLVIEEQIFDFKIVR